MRIASLLVLAVLAGGCVNKQTAHNGAVRFLNAVPDGPRISLYVDDVLKAAGYDYTAGSPFVAMGANTYRLRIDQLLPTAAIPNTNTIFIQSTDLAVNAELSLMVVGSVADNTVEVLQIPTTTQGVPTGLTLVQFVHAAVDTQPFDVYIVPPTADVTASTPLVSNLAYKSWNDQQELTSAYVKIVLTKVGDPATILFQSNTLFLTLEGSILIAVVQNPAYGADLSERPFALSILGSGGNLLALDKDTKSAFRLVNASPGTYSLDAFLNATTFDGSARQTCDPATTETDVFLELCAAPYTSVGPFNTIDSGSYQLKVQKTGDEAVAPQIFTGVFAAGGGSTAVMTGLIADSSTATTVGYQNVLAARRIGTAAQLRLVDVSLAADAAISGDPTTDQLQIFITAPGASLVGATPAYTGVIFGSDTGYVSEVAGNYQVTLASVDTAVTDAVPQVLLTEEVALANDGIYTLLMADSVGGVQPLQFLSLDDDTTPPP